MTVAFRAAGLGLLHIQSDIIGDLSAPGGASSGLLLGRRLALVITASHASTARHAQGAYRQQQDAYSGPFSAADSPPRLAHDAGVSPMTATGKPKGGSGLTLGTS